MKSVSHLDGDGAFPEHHGDFSTLLGIFRKQAPHYYTDPEMSHGKIMAVTKSQPISSQRHL